MTALKCFEPMQRRIILGKWNSSNYYSNCPTRISRMTIRNND